MSGLICSKCSESFPFRIKCRDCDFLNEPDYSNTICKGCGKDWGLSLSTWQCKRCVERRKRDERAAIDLFCPECGTLVFINHDGTFSCPSYKCGYSTIPSGISPLSTSTPTRDLDLDNDAISGNETPSMDNKSYKKNCYDCGKAIWMQYREEFNDYIPLDFGNGGNMKPHNC